ncbi:hypothetical protein SGCOL_009210 [Colletotrichum sp. CLE4]
MGISALNSKNRDFRKVAALSEALHADAVEYVDELLHESSILALQCLILLIQLALLLPQTSNLWYITGEAMRMAVSLGLHQEPDARVFRDPGHAEQRRRIFWVVYQLDRVVSISGGCPVALSDEHITTRLPHGGGDISELSETADFERVSHPKERQFLLDLQVCVMKSEIQATQFFDRPVPSHSGSHDEWVQRMDQRIQSLYHVTTANGRTNLQLSSSCLQCQVMLHRPCSRNIAVSEASLVSVVKAAVDLISLDTKTAESGGLVMVFEIGNRVFQAGMLLLYALRNHASTLQRASLADNAADALKNLAELLSILSSRWPPLADTASYINELIDTKLRNPVGHNGSLYDMQVLEELDCLVTQRRIHSIRHRNIPFPPPKKFTPPPSETENISQDFINDEQWWTDFIDQDYVSNESYFSLPSGGQPTSTSSSPDAVETRAQCERGARNNNASDLEEELGVILDAIPSCSFCRDRRTKCQRQLPACKECARTSRECLIFDPILKTNIPLRQIQLLVDELKDIAKQTPPPCRPSNETHHPPATGNPLFLPSKPFTPPQAGTSPSSNLLSTTFFGPWSSFGCLRDHLRHNRASTHDFSPTLLRLTSRTAIPNPSLQNLITFHPLPQTLATPLFALFSHSINTFFPILQPQTLTYILTTHYHNHAPSPNTTTTNTNTPLFNLIIALGALIASKSTPSLLPLAESHFQTAIPSLPTTCAHASRTKTLALLQRTLLICVYTLLEPSAGDVWRHLGFAIRLFLDLSHRPSMEEDKDHAVFSLSHKTTPTLRSTCETYRQTLDSWSATWQQSTTSSSPTTSPASKDALLAWGSLHHHHALSLITTLWPTPGGNALTICGGVSQAALQLLRHQQVFANLAYEEAKVGAPLPAEEEVLIFPFDWTMSHLVFQAGLRAMGEKDTTLLPTSEKNPAQCPPLQQCFSMLLLLEADASKLLRGQSLVFEALSEKINM